MDLYFFPIKKKFATGKPPLHEASTLSTTPMSTINERYYLALGVQVCAQ